MDYWCRLTAAFSLFLSDPSFVGSAFIQESLPKGNLVGDDDKIYFFFSEAGKEFDFFDNTIVSRIARVCKVSGARGQSAHPNGQPFFFLFFLSLCTLSPPPGGSFRKGEPRLHHCWNLTSHCALCVRPSLARRQREKTRLALIFFSLSLSDDLSSPVTEKHSSRVPPLPPLFDSFAPHCRLPRSLSSFAKYLRSTGTRRLTLVGGGKKKKNLAGLAREP